MKPVERKALAAGLTQREAAALVYASTSAWEEWEQGRRRIHPGIWELFQIKARRII